MFTSVVALAALVAGAAAKGVHFDKYVAILLENEDLSAVQKNHIFAGVAAQGIAHLDYKAVAHPSQPNYWATVSGAHNFTNGVFAQNGTAVNVTSINGNNGDGAYDIPNVKIITNLLKDAGLSYGVYSQNYPTPGACWQGAGFGSEGDFVTVNKSSLNANSQGVSGTQPREYVRKHNPFLSFPEFTSDADNCKTQNSFVELTADVAAGKLPDYTFVVPNQIYDNHDTTIDFTGTWFGGFIQQFIDYKDAVEGTRVLIHIVYDEDDSAYAFYYNDPVDNEGNPNPHYNATAGAGAPEGCTDLNACTLDTNNNRVYSVLLGNAVPAALVGTTDSADYTHYSILQTLEQNWGLPSLGTGD
ncbi:hypothetical protein HK101_001968, partial [Irineochytrium annulatum]